MKPFMCGLAALAMIVTASSVSAFDVTQHQWARPSADGNIVGRVVVPRADGINALRDAKVTLVNAEGKHVAEPVMSDKTGRFALVGVNPGVYTLMIQGDGAFACCAMHVVGSDVPLNSEFEIAAGVIDFSTVRSAMVRYAPPASSATPVAFSPEANPWSTDRAVVGGQIRVVQKEGGLNGRITKAGFEENLGAANTNVMVFQDGVEVARTTTDATGNFRVNDLPAGSYSVMGVGEAGFGLLGVEVIDSLAVQSVQVTGDQDVALVAKQGDFPETFVMQISPVPAGPITVIDDQLIDEQEIGIAVPDGPGMVIDSGFAGTGGTGAVGGGAGGGSGGLFGGGLGGLGALGLGAAGLAVALADDSNAIVVPPPVSPSTP